MLNSFQRLFNLLNSETTPWSNIPNYNLDVRTDDLTKIKVFKMLTKTFINPNSLVVLFLINEM